MGIASDADTGAGRPAPEEAGAIAVVGLSCRFPRAAGPEAFRRLLHGGAPPSADEPRDAAGQPDGGRTRAAALLDPVNRFEPEFFGISAAEAAAMEPQQRLVLELAWEALESAGILPEGLAGSETGVFLGAVADDGAAPLRPHGADAALTGLSRGTLANRVSHVFGLRGPSLVVDTAQSSALTAVHLACQALRAGECTEALAGGAAVSREVDTASVGGRARADGGVLVLKTLRRALADGDTVHCLIRGGAVSNEGGDTPAGPPATAAREDVLRRAYTHAGADPAATRFVELHGADTAAGDGIAALIKTVLCLREAVLVAGSPHAEVSPEAPHLRSGDRGQPLVRHGDEPVLAEVSAFGAGGTNCHVVLSDWRPQRVAAEPAPRPGPAQCARSGVPVTPALSAGTTDTPRTRAARLHTHLAAYPGYRPDGIAPTLLPVDRRAAHATPPGPTAATAIHKTVDGTADPAADLDDEQVLEIIGELPLQRLREAGLLSRLLELAGHA
ncbi:polyketide synthase [Streptomyces pinistramenti]|uniref:polyketide synthase n=1 Tax=Streptomyces pinistramenti TaxID=2884812 RepID=UPI002221F485|nr:polyketide synthase [Streptomyces pinistramenti]